MANNRAIRIAAPILAKSYKAETGEPLRPVKSIQADLRAALEAARPPVRPCVVEDWVNEPARRAGIAKMHRERVDLGKRRRAADQKRREAKAARRKKIHRLGTKIVQKAGRIAGRVRRMFTMKSSRGQ